MLDFNAGELVLLGVFAVIIFGPEKLPELARKAARVIHYVRNIANDAQGRLREELGPEYADLQLSDLNPKALVNKHLLQPVQSEIAPITSELAPVKSELVAVGASGAASSGAAKITAESAATPVAGESDQTPNPASSNHPAFDTEAT